MKNRFLPYWITIATLILGGLLPSGLLALYDSKTFSQISIKSVTPLSFYSSHQSFDTLLLLSKEHILRPLATSYASLTTSQVEKAVKDGLDTFQDIGLYHPSSFSLRSAEAYALYGTDVAPFDEVDVPFTSGSSAIVWKVVLTSEDNSLTEVLLDDATNAILSISHWSAIRKEENLAEKQASLSAFASNFSSFCQQSYELIEVSISLSSYPDQAELSFLTTDGHSLSFSLTLSGNSFSVSVKQTAD